MRVYISYSTKDEPIADQVVSALQRAGIDAWYGKREILPGDNWGEKIAEGLRASDAMVILLSPDSLQSQQARWELEYALGSATYSNRLITVLVGQEDQFPEDRVPWILRKLKVVRLAGSVANADEFGKIAQALKGAA
ncbi:MAG TPA: toll/interleukin-1 receptor domain-containing protein [Blastocatellia bacterium]